MPTEELLLRPAESGDAAAVAALHLRARRAAVPLMPPPVHSDEAVLAFVAGTLDSETLETWVAHDASGVLLGYASITATWLDALYVAPAHQRGGVGSALLQLVIALRPDGFGLWVFSTNTPARQLYRRHGLLERETTDGRDNEERRPDVRMEWVGPSAAPAGDAPVEGTRVEAAAGVPIGSTQGPTREK